MRKSAQVKSIVLAVAALTSTGVEDAVEAVEPAVGPPGQRVGQLVRVGPAEAGDDDLRLVGRLAVGAFLAEEDVGRVGDPDAAVADGDARGDVQPLGKDGELVGLAVAVGVFEDLDAVAARPGANARIFEALGDPDRPRSSKVIATGLTMSGSAATSSTWNPAAPSSS